MAQETGVQSQVKLCQRLKKWYSIPPCLILTIKRYRSRVVEQSRKSSVVPFLHLGVVVNGKKSLRVTLNYGHQLYLYFISNTTHKLKLSCTLYLFDYQKRAVLLNCLLLQYFFNREHEFLFLLCSSSLFHTCSLLKFIIKVNSPTILLMHCVWNFESWEVFDIVAL